MTAQVFRHNLADNMELLTFAIWKHHRKIALSMKFTLIFLTNLPAFYKINLYNRIEGKLNASGGKILVIYTGLQGDDRNEDFLKGQMRFEHLFLKGGKLARCRQLLGILHGCRYESLVIGGWDSMENWVAALFSQRRKNSVVAESSVWESKTDGLKGLAKKLFIRRIGRKAYVPGVSNARLMEKLGFKGEIVCTKGVGIFNFIKQPPYAPREKVCKFLFVGRLVEVKNLRMLIGVFNSLPQLTLTIAGFGVQEHELTAMAKDNIVFLGAVNNKELPEVYQSNDVFILPSKSEPWGLVVEEALNNGVPVIVSDRVGCHEAIVNGSNGIVFSPYNSEDALRGAIIKMTDISFYNNLRKNISELDFEKTEEEQVNCYL